MYSIPLLRGFKRQKPVLNLNVLRADVISVSYDVKALESATQDSAGVAAQGKLFGAAVFCDVASDVLLCDLRAAQFFVRQRDDATLRHLRVLAISQRK